MIPPCAQDGGDTYKFEPSVDKNILAKLKVEESLTPHTVELMGERIDMSNGSISFHQTDISLPGNSQLEVAIHRVFRGADFSYMNRANLGDWQLDIPHIHTTIQQVPNSMPSLSGSWGAGHECRGQLEPGPIFVSGSILESYQYWNGDTLNIPGSINEKLLYPWGDILVENHADKYTRVTKSNWRVECIDRYSASGEKLGEGFVAHSPAGDTYTFNVRKLLPFKPFNAKEGRKYNAYMMVTKIEDIHGNYVNYNYDVNANLLSIVANDGRKIELEYTDVNNSDHITKINANGQSWQYFYAGAFEKNLIKVIRPDGKFWHYDLNFIGETAPLWESNELCSFNAYNPNEIKGVITHPDGMRGEYYVKETLQGRSNVDLIRDNFSHQPLMPKCFSNMALVRKSLAGPNVPKLSWIYTYSQNKGTFSGQTAENAARLNIANLPAGVDPIDFKMTQVTSPDGSKARYYHNRNWQSAFEGLLFATEYFDKDGLTLLRKEINGYSVGNGLGHPMMRFENIKPFQYQTNLVSKRIQDYPSGIEYISNYLAYNEYGALVESNVSNFFGTEQRYTKTEYHKDTSKWVLNLPTKTYASDAATFDAPYKETSYNNDLLPYQEKLFGQVTRTYSYHADGNLLQTTYNGSGRYEKFENYYRGKARKITLPCATTNGCNTANGSTSNTQVALLEVNPDGTTKSLVDFNGNKTSYSYNPIGWLTKIDYADPKWADKVISYATVSTNDDGISGSGIAVGSLRQTISQGNYEKRVYHDGLLRPVFTRERDAANTSTIRYQTMAYDHENRPTLSSFPSADASNRIGMETEYDALGRVVTQTRTSDGSTSRREYLTGNKVAVTDGENNTTTTTYLAYGEPSFDKPTLIEAPDSDDIAIEYNLFDQVTSIRQGNVTETRLYDAYQQLCKQVRPETGITAFGYNGQRQPIWRAEGINGSTTACDASAVPTTHKVVLSYDNLGQLRTENFPDTTPDKTYSYDGNGNLTSLLAGSVNWTYLYNSSNAIEKETLALDGKNFVLDWEYNNLGGLSSLKYPSGAIVDFAPNALGQATKAGSYASGVSYHPNGQIKQFTYGNGIVRNVALDTTGRIDALTDIKVGSVKNSLDPSYDYNDNLARLIDWVDRNNDVDNLTYDGVDRLKSADGKWGTGRYNYDGLDNVLSRSLNNSTITYNYNSLNRLNNLTGAYAYGYQYDTRGNVINNGRYSLAYNLGQQMTSAKGISYVYDGHNRRVKQTKTDGSHYTVYSQGGQLLHRQAADGTKTDSVYLGK